MQALVGGRVLTEAGFVADHAVLIDRARIAAVVPGTDVPRDAERVDLGGDLLAPGFIDLQVNGGGGVLFNDRPTVDGIRAIGEAHRRFGTTGFLPTLITTDRATMSAAIAAAREAVRRVPGALGIHLEGPHLSPARAGVHDPALMRPLEPADVDLLVSLRLGVTLVTLAPEMCATDLVGVLVERSVVVSAGHTNASYEQFAAGYAAGISAVTHLFNAMSPLVGREPGAVGAALALGDLACGIIVDGHHVHPASVRVAYAAKPAGKLFLVTDAMPPVGAAVASFELAGERIEVAAGRCLDRRARLAGAVLDMASAVRNAVRFSEIPLEAALAMASAAPAAVLGLARERGRIAPGLRADLVLLDGDLGVRATWIAGEAVWI